MPYLLSLNCSAFRAPIVPQMFRKVNTAEKNSEPGNPCNSRVSGVRFLREAENSFPLGVFFVILNYICLSFMQIHTHFYINYIIYYGLLIFCCHSFIIAKPVNLATHF